jgi:uncharacterized protein DUF5666
MTSTTTEQHRDADGSGPVLPTPRCGARWRWSAPRAALVAGGALTAVLGLGTAATATTRPAGPPGGRPAGSRPTIGGKVTAIESGSIVVLGRSGTTTVLDTASTTYTTLGRGPGRTTSASRATAVKVGDFVGVRGTRNADGSVTATSVTIFTRSPFRPAGTSPGAGRPGVAPSA